MIARQVTDPFDRDGWYFELKWDGFRTIAEKDRQGVQLYSRNQNDFMKRFPVIAEAVRSLDNVVLDGEICALDEHGHPRFAWLLNRGRQQGKLVYHVFDLLQVGDFDLRLEPLHRRKKLLQKILRKNDTLRYVEHIENNGIATFAAAIVLKQEGVRRQRQKQPLHRRPNQDLALAKNQKQRLPATREDQLPQQEELMPRALARVMD